MAEAEGMKSGGGQPELGGCLGPGAATHVRGVASLPGPQPPASASRERRRALLPQAGAARADSPRPSQGPQSPPTPECLAQL